MTNLACPRCGDPGYLDPLGRRFCGNAGCGHSDELAEPVEMITVPTADHQGAVEALEEILADLRRPDAPRPDHFPAVAHAIQVAEGALARLRGGQ